VVRSRRSRCRAGNPGTRRQGRRRRNRRPTVEAYEGSPMQSLVQIAIGGGGRHARAAVRAVGALDGVCVLGTGAAVVAQGVGGVETRPLARPPKGQRKRSHSMPPSRDDGGVERRQCRGARQLASRLEWLRYGGARWPLVTARADLREMWMREDLHAG
jgi:hypothetical protein